LGGNTAIEIAVVDESRRSYALIANADGDPLARIAVEDGVLQVERFGHSEGPRRRPRP
jgi:hypothetical protein